jgi:hypothetical protein
MSSNKPSELVSQLGINRWKTSFADSNVSVTRTMNHQDETMTESRANPTFSA